MSSTSARLAAPGRGRDLPLLRLDVVTGQGVTTFESILCPRERRARPIEECAPCLDAGGPVTDPAARERFMACAAGAEPKPAPTWMGAEPSAADRTLVAGMMTRAVVAVCGDVPLSAARAALLDGEVESLPVVDRGGRPIGLLGVRDLVRAPPAADDTRCVADVMSRRVPSVSETAPVSEVAALMARDGAALVSVVSREGRVVGVATALDLVRWLAEQDDRGPRPLP